MRIRVSHLPHLPSLQTNRKFTRWKHFAASSVYANMQLRALAVAIFSASVLAGPQASRLGTADAVLERYKQALGGVDAIKSVQSETIRGEIERTGLQGKATFVGYSKPFKSLFKVTLPNGGESDSGFDGTVSWSMTPQGASIDKDTPLESVRRDADLQYALHQPDYFKKLEFDGVTDFEGHHCYWLHGTTHWGKDNNQFYDIETGLLVGYRYQADAGSPVVNTAVFSDYKRYGRRLTPTKLVNRSSDRTQTLTIMSVTYEPLADSLFDLPPAVKALLK
jgi:hypothetical protein